MSSHSVLITLTGINLTLNATPAVLLPQDVAQTIRRVIGERADRPAHG